MPNPDNGSLSLIAPQSHEEPVPAIAASLDDELSRYFFDLETPPGESDAAAGESDAAAGESDAARVNGRNIARNR